MRTQRDAVHCPVCGESSRLAYIHAEADIYRCRQFTHAFSDQQTIRAVEDYSPAYYEKTHRNWFANPNLALFEWIERHIPAGAESNIDVGCGRGDFLDFVRAKRPAVRLVGVDLSENQPRDNIEFYRGDAANLEIGTFDAVVSMATIEHVTDVSAFASSLHNLCAPGGVAFVMTLDDGSLLYRASRLAWRFGISAGFDRLYSAHHLHHFTRQSLAQLFERAGLNLRGSLHCSVPLRALDLPVTPLARPLFLAGVKIVFSTGDLFGLSYLQTLMLSRSETAAP